MPNEPLQGRILQELLYEAKTTSQLAKELNANLTDVRRELIRLHHLGCIHPIAERLDPRGGLRLYFRDFVWDATLHMREHDEIDRTCSACRVRERILLRAPLRP